MDEAKVCWKQLETRNLKAFDINTFRSAQGCFLSAKTLFFVLFSPREEIIIIINVPIVFAFVSLCENYFQPCDALYYLSSGVSTSHTRTITNNSISQQNDATKNLFFKEETSERKKKYIKDVEK